MSTGSIWPGLSSLKVFSVHLHAEARCVDYEHAELVVHAHRRRPPKAFLAVQVGDVVPPPQHVGVRHQPAGAQFVHWSVADHGLNEQAAMVELHDPVVAAVANVNVSVGVDRYVARPLQRDLVGSKGVENMEQFAIRREALHPVVAPVGYKHTAIEFVDRDAPRVVELTRLRALLSEPANVFAVQGELLHT